MRPVGGPWRGHHESRLCFLRGGNHVIYSLQTRLPFHPAGSQKKSRPWVALLCPSPQSCSCPSDIPSLCFITLASGVLISPEIPLFSAFLSVVCQLSDTQVSGLTQPSVPSLRKNGQGRHSCILITASWLSGFLRKYLKLYLHLNIFTFRELISSFIIRRDLFLYRFLGKKVESITCEKARLPRES